jgi:hypothetical protein
MLIAMLAAVHSALDTLPIDCVVAVQKVLRNMAGLQLVLDYC